MNNDNRFDDERKADVNLEDALSVNEGVDEKNANKQPAWKTGLKEVFDWAIHIAAAVIIAMLIVKFVAQVTVVVGTSMMPTLEHNDRLMMDKLTLRFRDFSRGDIVVVEAKEELVRSGNNAENSPLIKRVIAVEGDIVEIKEGSVFVNEEELREFYIYGDRTYGKPDSYDAPIRLEVPEGKVFVLGDNRHLGGSIDSRELGPFSVDRIIGRVVFRIFPLESLGGLK